jgi:hypothetical protein
MGKSLIDSNNFGAARVRRAEKNAGHRAKPTWCRRENPQKGLQNMKKYQLFGEWRGVTLYGNDLADALMRERTLRTPTQYAPKGPGWTAPVVVGGGEEWAVADICDVFSPANSTRGGKPYLRAVVKFADNRIREVDAVEVV